MKVIYSFEVEVPDLGNRILEARGDRRIKVLAQRAGLSGGYWRQLERGRGSVTREAIAFIEDALGIKLVEDMEIVKKEGDRNEIA